MRHYWVDRIVEIESGARAVGLKSVALSEDAFDEHFPGNPVLPGIFLLEGLAQTAGVLFYRSTAGRQLAVLGSADRVKFVSFARPGDLVTMEVAIESMTDSAARVRGTARVGDRVVASAAMTFLLVAPEKLIPPLYRPHWERAMSVWLGDYPDISDG
jgi:3-hydroxyacyl-[acyl-carrier-protein] dehydratase